MSITLKLAKIICALAACVLLGACSAIKLGYNNIDQVAYWWLDGYVDFTDTQAVRVREDMDRLHLWHRTKELPRYVEMLQKMEQMVAGEISSTQACEVLDMVRQRVDVLATQAEPAAVTLAIDLSPEQMTHLQRKYQRNNADFRKDWIDKTAIELREKRFNQLLERSEMIYGDLDAAQRAALRKQISQSRFDPRRTLADREKKQKDFLATIAKLKGQSLEQARVSMHALLERAQRPSDTVARAYQDGLFEESCKGFAAVHAATTAVQRDAAVRRLRAYQRDLRELTAQR